ncbi:MAG: hypothetical protein O4808_06435 [Trichodesmium sp. St17_bin3_1_1]|nr:hypothetical protein [Trichodesmium sp. St17_bin3_1_1]
MTEEQRLELREILNYKYNDKELLIYIDEKFQGYYKDSDDFYTNGQRRENYEHIEGEEGIYIFSA